MLINNLVIAFSLNIIQIINRYVKLNLQTNKSSVCNGALDYQKSFAIHNNIFYIFLYIIIVFFGLFLRAINVHGDF